MRGANTVGCENFLEPIPTPGWMGIAKPNIDMTAIEMHRPN